MSNEEKLFGLRKTIVIRFERNDKVNTSKILTWIQNERRIRIKDNVISKECMPPADDESTDQYIIVELFSAWFFDEILKVSKNGALCYEDVQLRIYELVGLNGVRTADTISALKCYRAEYVAEDEMEYLMYLIEVYSTKRKNFVEEMKELIDDVLNENIYEPTVTVYGSYASSCRSNGFSDVDMSITCDAEGEKRNVMCRNGKKLAKNSGVLRQTQLNKEEFSTFELNILIKIFYNILTSNSDIKQYFNVSYACGRTPVVQLKSKNMEEYNVSFDITANNNKGVEKARFLDLFMMKDISKNNKMRQCMVFFCHWGRCNKLLSGGYTDEQVSTNFNSYIFNHMIIHFVQVHDGQRCLVHPNNEEENRVSEYDFDGMFKSYQHFFQEMFKYYSAFKYSSNVIHNNSVIGKILAKSRHNTPETPFMIIDPLDNTHNITSTLVDDDLKAFNRLLRNSLRILKQDDFKLVHLLEADSHDKIVQKLKKTDNSEVHISDGESVTISVPDFIKTSPDVLILLQKVLGFTVSNDHPGSSNPSLADRDGVAFAVNARTWMGRRSIKRKFKNDDKNASSLQIEIRTTASILMDTAEEDQADSIVETRITMTKNEKQTLLKFNILKGDINDLKTIVTVFKQFLENYGDDLERNGVSSLQSM